MALKWLMSGLRGLKRDSQRLLMEAVAGNGRGLGSEGMGAFKGLGVQGLGVFCSGT